MSEEGEEEEERGAEDEQPMDTSPGGGLHSRLANGLPAARAAGGDSFNGHPPSGSAGIHNHYGSSSHVGFSDAERHKAICSSFWKAAKDIKPIVNLIPNYTLENLAHLIL